MAKVYGEAESLTSEVSRGQAAVTDAFVNSFTKGIEVLAARFTDRLDDVLKDWANNKIGNILKPVPQSKKPAKTGPKGYGVDDFTNWIIDK